MLLLVGPRPRLPWKLLLLLLLGCLLRILFLLSGRCCVRGSLIGLLLAATALLALGIAVVLF